MSMRVVDLQRRGSSPRGEQLLELLQEGLPEQQRVRWNDSGYVRFTFGAEREDAREVLVARLDRWARTGRSTSSSFNRKTGRAGVDLDFHLEGSERPGTACGLDADGGDACWSVSIVLGGRGEAALARGSGATA